MKTLIATISLVDFTAPAGTVVDHYLAELSDGQSARIELAGPLTASFTVNADGDYSFKISARAADDSVIGEPIVSNVVTVTIPPATITVQIPGVAELAIAADQAPAAPAA
jgi:hypothetical protein